MHKSGPILLKITITDNFHSLSRNLHNLMTQPLHQKNVPNSFLWKFRQISNPTCPIIEETSILFSGLYCQLDSIVQNLKPKFFPNYLLLRKIMRHFIKIGKTRKTKKSLLTMRHPRVRTSFTNS